jgi:steroid delta-isomerase-like uncharacterized protein
VDDGIGLDRLEQFCAVGHGSRSYGTRVNPSGPRHDAVRAFFRELFAAFPDFTMTVDRVVADDTSAVVQWHAAGTFTGGPFQGITPTGRRADIRGVDVMEITDGLIKHTIYYDGATFARQIGLLPGLGSRADQALLAAFNAKTTLSQRARRRQRRPSRAR